MARFEDLILRSGQPAEAQETARIQLPLTLAESNLHLWRPGDRIEEHGFRFLIGVAVWSVYDMRLLDALDDALSGERIRARTDVFDMDSLQPMTCIEDYIPQVGTVHQTPVVGTWQDGEQINHSSGAAAREMVAKYFGIDHKRLITLPGIKV